MSRAARVSLLDVNMLVALFDPDHLHHEIAHDWFADNHAAGWATCPLTENGFVRILGHKNYPNFKGGTEAARDVLQKICLLPGHQFWPDSVSVRDRTVLPGLPVSKHITDCYLLALAVERGGRFATLDHAVDASKVRGGAKALLTIPR